MRQRFPTFAEFWPWYLTRHRLRSTRLIHAFGSLAVILCSFVAFPLTGNLWWAVIGVAMAYGTAWPAHRFLERNAPATWSHPFWSMLADFEMFALVLSGRDSAELAGAAPGERPGPAGAARAAARGVFRVALKLYFIGLALAIWRDDVKFWALWA